MEFLKDDVIKLRAVEPSDAVIMWSIESDSTQWESNSIIAPYSLHNLREYAENYDADPFRAGQLRLIVELLNNENADSEIIGLCDLFEISSVHRTAQIGIYIKQSFRRKGYAIRALGLCEAYASQLLNLRIIAAKIMCGNVDSEQLFIKCGYIYSGRIDDWFVRGDNMYDLLIYSKKII